MSTTGTVGRSRSLLVPAMNQPAMELPRVNYQELSTREGVGMPLSSDADWVEKTMCFSADEVPPWLKLRAGAFNVAPEIKCRLHYVERRNGDCYKLALLGCLHGGEFWTLVHGETVGPKHIGRMGHAWLERDGWVYDPVLDRIWPWHIYARFVGAVSMKSYSYSETFRFAKETGHCGPWSVRSA